MGHNEALMIYRVFGRRNDTFNELLTEATFEHIQKCAGPDNRVELYDMDDNSVEYRGLMEHPCYCPCIQCMNDDGQEMGYIENKYFYNIKEAEYDSSMSRVWWYFLERWMEDMNRNV